jgi:hypothetical protein
MKAVLIVLLVLGVTVFALGPVLTWLNNAYDELIGRPQAEQRARWLRSMGTESGAGAGERVGATALERMIVLSVYVAGVSLLIWFFFLAGSPLPQG